MRILNLLRNQSKYLRSRRSCRRASIIPHSLQRATFRSLIVYLLSHLIPLVRKFLESVKITVSINQIRFISVRAHLRVSNKKKTNNWRSLRRRGGTARKEPNTIKVITKINNMDRATKDYRLLVPG